MSRPPLSPGSHKGAAVLFLIPSHLANELFPFWKQLNPAVTRTRPPSRLPARFRQLRAAILQKSPRFAHFRRTSANIPHVFPHNIPHNQETPAAWDC